MPNIKNGLKKIKRAIRIMLAPVILILLLGSYYFLVLDRETEPVIEEGMDYEIKTEQYANRNVFVVSPKSEEKSDTVIFYMHGGAYIEEMSPDYWTFIEKIVNDTNVTIVIPDYPLAPKHDYNDVFNMIEPMYDEMIQSIDPKNITLMGDSAGGGMALALLEKLNEKSMNVPKQTILISPWLDVTMENPYIDEVQKVDTILNKEVLRLAGISYADEEANIRNYLVSPMFGDLSKVNNVTIFTGTYDILNPDVHVLSQKVQEQGGNVLINEYEMAKHIWLIKNNTSESITLKAYNDLIEQIRK